MRAPKWNSAFLRTPPTPQLAKRSWISELLARKVKRMQQETAP